MTGAKSDLSRLRLSARKSFGQNFLENAADLHAIAGALEAGSGQTVLEIGPGLGALTGILLEKGMRVTAVEKDRSLAAHLNSHFKEAPLRVICADILKFDPRDAGFGAPVPVAGNIPYNITSPILFWLVDHRASFTRAVLTVQWEVAQRLTGKPGNKVWGALSVSVQAYAEAKLLKKVPRGHFYPAPNVDSAVVVLDFLPKPRYREGQGGLFHELVARAFQKRRKTLLNALEDAAQARPKEALTPAFARLGIDAKRRPETLSVQEWADLADCLSKPERN
jgi:16S rRNA (adenine1518-N6/adenine1519-N6)-dimethyltransferase